MKNKKCLSLQLFYIISLLISSHFAFAQSGEGSVEMNIVSEREKTFFFGVLYGVGNTSVRNFLDQRISSEGHSLITGMVDVNLVTGYAFSAKQSVYTGLNIQILSLQFHYNDETHRLNGTRNLIPLKYRRSYIQESSNFRFFLELGAYYAFSGQEPLIEKSTQITYDKPLDAFGINVGLGFLYRMHEQLDFIFSYNSMADLFSVNNGIIHMSVINFSTGVLIRVF